MRPSVSLVALALLLTACSGDASPAPITTDLPSITPMATASGSVPSPTGWRLIELPGSNSQALLRDVAAGSGRIVVVGETSCSDSQETVCYGTISTSTDGETFVPVPLTPSLEVGGFYTLSGPQPGFIDVAAGPGGFVLLGYVSTGGPESVQVDPGLWRSDDGLAWERVDTGSLFEDGRPAAIEAVGSGYMVVGAFIGLETPRAAVWTSPDGRSWERIADQAAFDVGGYIDTGETPVSGGMLDLAAFGDQLIAVGMWCAGGGFSEMPGPCRPVIWTSPDGKEWTQVDLRTGSDSAVFVSVAARDDRVVVVGSVDDGDPSTGEPSAPLSLSSVDARTWAASTADTTSPFDEVIAVQGGFVALTAAGGQLGAWTSADGASWRELDGVPWVDDALVIDALGAAVTDDHLVIVGWMERSGSPGISGFVLTGEISLFAP